MDNPPLQPTGSPVRFIRRLVLRLALAFLLVSGAMLVAGQWLIRPLLPLFKAELEWLTPLQVQRLDLCGADLQLTFALPVEHTDRRGRFQTNLTTDVHTSTTSVLIAPAIVLMLLLAWPLAWRRRLLALALAFPLLVLVELSDLPLALLWGAVEAFAGDVARVRIHGTPENIAMLDEFFGPRSGLTFWKLFLSTGGRQFLALAIFMVALAPFYLRRPGSVARQLEATPAGRNAPCPCGSGRKYKNCCGKNGSAQPPQKIPNGSATRPAG